MNVLIIDYSMGNLGSVRRAFEECGARVFLSEDPRDVKTADHLVLPGVGAFADGMTQLRNRGWVEYLNEAVREEKIPLLGICLGMQLLADRGFEGGETEGLGYVRGTVSRLEPDTPSARIPHVGWNEVILKQPSPLFDGIADGTDFYFVHSYHCAAADPGQVLAVTPYCGGFVSAMCNENVFGVQFHPEKSSRPGFRLIRNFLGQ